MKIIFSGQLTLYAFISIFAYGSSVIRTPKRFTIVETLLDNLHDETWDPDENPCLQYTVSLLEGVKNNTLWAFWAWNSMQLPSGTFNGNIYHFGNYDQCMSVPWPAVAVTSQYCLVDVKMADLNNYDGEAVDSYDAADKYIGANFRQGMRLNTLSIGVCLPSVCKPNSIAKISRNLLKFSHLPIKELTVNSKDCQIAGADVWKPMGYYVFWFILIIMISLSVYVYYFENYSYKTYPLASIISQCFCLTRNFESLTKVQNHEILVLHGIRTLTSSLVVMAHALIFVQFFALHNKMDAVKEQSGFYLKFVNADFGVDTFFMISGLLQVRKFMSSSSYRPFDTILQRYIRLLFPVYFFTIMCTTYVFPYIGSGPAWPRFSRTIYEPCNSWRRNLLLYTNKVNEGAHHCSDISWYVHTDFHLTILATFIFSIYRWNRKKSFIVCALVYLISVIVPTVWIYGNRLPPVLLYDFGECQSFSTNKVYNTVYKPFFTRASTYIIGMAMGYLMSIYKAQYCKKSISKKMSILIAILGLGLMFLCLQIREKQFNKVFGALNSAFLATFDRTIWSIGVCLIIIACEYGTLPLINTLLTNKMLVPLSKLSYSNYLVHSLLLYRNFMSMRTPATFDLLTLITNSLGYVVISYLASFFLWLFIEAPVSNLISLLFHYKRRTNKIITASDFDDSAIKCS